jgi:chromosome segregation ATPase
MYGLDGLARIFKAEPSADERIKKLAEIQSDLQAAVAAVGELQESATKSKKESDQLQSEIARLREDRAVAEDLMKVPEEAFARMLSRASAKGRGRGLMEGIVVGLFTGVISSLVVWYFTTN